MRNGTAIMSSENELKTEEVCRILEACAKSGVSELMFRTLTVRFDRPVEQTVVKLPDTAPAQVRADQEKMAKESLLQDEIQVREDQIADLMITDPVTAEELIRSGELEEDDGRRPEDEA